MTYLIAFCALSVLLNVGLVWYIKQILTKLLFISQNQGDLFLRLDSFSNHLKSLYELETFYGDESLMSLIEHMNLVLEEVEQYEEIYTLMDEEGEVDGTTEEETEI
tara:strand:+ start:256 stop:573 length:318 start_codon:yes stop_codon:yes gene_type:complete